MRFVVLGLIGIAAAAVAFVLVRRLNDVPISDGFLQQGSMQGAADIVEAVRQGAVEKSAIPLEEIHGGGPRKDGIPSLDNPRVISAAEAKAQFNADDFGIAVTAGGETRFYPYRILVWHEIVNDTIGGVPLLVTYCPLCFTGIAFNRTVVLENGPRALEFGVSGLLHNNNLLMYNRVRDPADPPENLWSQVRGEAVVGGLTGTPLRVWADAETVPFGAWVAAHPEGTVLSRETGYARNYDADPYGDYYDRENSRLLFPLSFSDERLARKEVVEGVVIGGKTKAYVRSALLTRMPLEDRVGGVPVVWKKGEAGAPQLFRSDTGDRLGVVEAFWFSWFATHPDTALWP